jgi:hypothetical protein
VGNSLDPKLFKNAGLAPHGIAVVSAADVHSDLGGRVSAKNGSVLDQSDQSAVSRRRESGAYAGHAPSDHTDID